MKFIKITFFLLFIWSKELPAQNLNVQKLWGSYYGPEGSRFYGQGLKEDKAGNLYGVIQPLDGNPYAVTDYMNSFVTTNSFDTYHPENNPDSIFFFKLSPQGNVLWSTFFPGGILDMTFPPDSQGVYFCGGISIDTDLIASENAVFPDPYEFGTDYYTRLHGFLVKFDTNGQKLWGTYLPEAWRSATDEDGNIYITGMTHNPDIFGTENVFQEDFHFVYENIAAGEPWKQNAYILKMNPQGQILWSTYYGVYANISGIDVKNGSLYIGGKASTDYNSTNGTSLPGNTSGMYLSKFNTDGQRIWSTYYGNGTPNESINKIKVTSDDKVLISGVVTSTTNIATSGTFRENKMGTNDYFIAQFDENGNREWGTYYGGDGNDTYGSEISSVMDANTNYIFASGATKSTGGVATLNGMNTAISNANYNDAIINIFDYIGNRLWGSYYGGFQHEIDSGVIASIDGNSFYHYGTTWSQTGITTPNGAYPVFSNSPLINNFETNIYITKFSIGTLSNPAFNSDEISLYPNPNNGSFTLSGSVLGKENFQMQVFNMQGQQLVDRNLSLYEEQNFNFSSYLTKGVYVLKLKSENQKKQKTFKFLVQ
jgi:hypothetical protein